MTTTRHMLQVTNPAEYGVDYFNIECFDWHGSFEGWAVPAWEERNMSELCGPFATREEALAALDAHLEKGDEQ